MNVKCLFYCPHCNVNLLPASNATTFLYYFHNCQKKAHALVIVDIGFG